MEIAHFKLVFIAISRHVLIKGITQELIFIIYSIGLPWIILFSYMVWAKIIPWYMFLVILVFRKPFASCFINALTALVLGDLLVSELLSDSLYPDSAMVNSNVITEEQAA